MDFHLAFTPPAFTQKIKHTHSLFLIGSCFTENIGSKLKQLKFSVLENPHGILFNPISIVHAMDAYIQNRQYIAADIFYQNECWHSWQHHSRFSHPDKDSCLQGINEAIHKAHLFLKTADWIMITAGSSFVYELTKENDAAGAKGHVVANCHKVPADKFNKRLLHPHETVTALNEMLHKLFEYNPAVKIIFTISPVRHLRDGFIENNRSKAALIQAIHQLTDRDKRLFYFPAYELVIDDLRDYRFYAEDMVHPNYAATNYVWEKFVTASIHEPDRQVMKEINTINAAKNHTAFNPASSAHKNFLENNLQKVLLLRNQYPYIDFTEEEKFFSGQ